MPEVQNNMGFALYKTGRLDDAEKWFLRAARSDPRYADPRAALRINPCLTEAHSNLGIALAQQGRLDEAIEHFREAVRLDPADSESRQNLDHALSLRRGR